MKILLCRRNDEFRCSIIEKGEEILFVRKKDFLVFQEKLFEELKRISTTPISKFEDGKRNSRTKKRLLKSPAMPPDKKKIVVQTIYEGLRIAQSA